MCTVCNVMRPNDGGMCRGPRVSLHVSAPLPLFSPPPHCSTPHPHTHPTLMTWPWQGQKQIILSEPHYERATPVLRNRILVTFSWWRNSAKHNVVEKVMSLYQTSNNVGLQHDNIIVICTICMYFSLVKPFIWCHKLSVDKIFIMQQNIPSFCVDPSIQGL